jgi:Cu(I)/Ag(I) efflux system membrane fusion protein
MKNIINTIKDNYKWAIIILFAGIFLGWLFFHSSGENQNSISKEQTGHEGHDHAQESTTLWTCSMHPQIKQDKPGKCPICAMDLVPLSDLSSNQEDVDPDEIQMTESAAKLADIQTINVNKGIPEKELFLQGKVQTDERRISELTARFGGRIEKLFVSFTGENVKKGDKLATIYSPDLVTAQRELLESSLSKETRPALYKAARGKLRLWDLTDEQIDNIEESGEPQLYFDILSPMSGTVSKRHVALGDYVKEGSALFQVIDLTYA